MTWLRLEDNMLDHPKWRRAIRLGGDAVLAVWVRLVSWCSRNLTDGVIPADMVHDVAETRGDRSRRRALDALVESSLVARDEQGRCTIADYLERNPSRAEVLADRAKRAQAQKSRRLGSAVTGHAETSDPERNGVPSRPVPSHPNPPADQSGAEVVIKRIPEDWVASAELIANAELAGCPPAVFHKRLAELRRGPIGGDRGVFLSKLDEYVLAAAGKWKTWDETDRARALQVQGSPRLRGAGAPFLQLEPTAKQLAYAKQHGLDVAEIVASVLEEQLVDKLGLGRAREIVGERLTRAAREKGRRSVAGKAAVA